jgi:hypothetical protein
MRCGLKSTANLFITTPAVRSWLPKTLGRGCGLAGVLDPTTGAAMAVGNVVKGNVVQQVRDSLMRNPQVNGDLLRMQGANTPEAVAETMARLTQRQRQRILDDLTPQYRNGGLANNVVDPISGVSREPERPTVRRRLLE